MTAPTSPAAAGAIIRAARLRATPKLSIEAAAIRAGMSTSHWSAVERGKAMSYGNPVNVPPETIARMLSVLPPLTGDERSAMEQARPGDAAEILAGITAQPGAPVGAGASDRLIERLIADRPDREVLEFLWRELGPDGKLAPRDRREQRVFEWVESHPLLESAPESETG